ncbi:CFA77 protein, partial [Rhynochetos jubatus]|nr:CFA77 protein [Rhynochetos jubatus]
QAELGKPQRNCYTLPGLDFSYGLYTHRTDGGVPEAIGHWNTVKPRTTLGQKMPRDFITMNRGALKAGYSTAHEFNLYYKANDIRCKDYERSRFKKRINPGDDVVVFSMFSRSYTPFFDLLQHKYKELWMEQQRALTAVQQKEKKHKVSETRTTFLRKHPPRAKEESFWHLPRFEKVGPHLSTFPDCDARKKAFSA